jgi:23S rRNA pseudouridine1911/1915/1917 synthase
MVESICSAEPRAFCGDLRIFVQIRLRRGLTQCGGVPLTIELTPEDAGKRLDHVVHAHFPQFSRARVQDWIKNNHVLVNGIAVRSSYLVRGAEAIEVEPADPRPLRAEPEDIPLTILYEDDDLVAIDKPAGMVVHSGAGVHSGTLVNALLHRFHSLSRTAGELRPGIVHRLDRYTSGVLLVAKNDAAHQALSAQFASRRVEKTYLAMVHGKVKLDSGRIEKPIARDPRQRVRMTARLTHGRTAWSEYRVLRRFSAFTFLEVRIGTGRTHQIRVHLASIGHPVVGDRLYGAPAKIEDEPALPRYFLHAHRIRFAQPSTGEPVTVESPLPADLEAWIKAAEHD